MNNPPKANHTPGKLRASQFAITDESRIVVAETRDFHGPFPNGEANAAELVRRWNCHEELLAACKLAAAMNIYGDLDNAKARDAAVNAVAAVIKATT